MTIAYYGSQISPHMELTPEGFLVCRDVPINRIGEQTYLAGELGLDGDPERAVTVRRYPEDVFDPAAVASFEGKDVTQGHPPENVTPENHAHYAKGHIQNVRRSGDFTVADLVVKDASLISDIRNGIIRQVSCGYTTVYVPDGGGYRQTNIRGNHVAVVLRGRAGSEVSIKDTAQQAEKGRKYMGKFGQAILEALGMAAHEAENPQEVQALVAQAASALDAAPEEKAERKPETPPAASGANDSKIEALAGKLDKVLAALDSLKPEEKPEDEKGQPAGTDDLDKMLEKLGGKEDGEKDAAAPAGEEEEAPLSPAAKDAAVAMLRSMRPVVAAIEDKRVRAQVTDALLASIRDQGKMGEIAAAAQAGAKQAADQAAMTSYEKRCAESQSAYAARNPHKRQEKEA